MRIVYACIYVVLCSGCFDASRDIDPRDYFSDAQVVDLIDAIERNDLAKMKQLIQQGVKLNAIGLDNKNPLDWALKQRKKEAFLLLLESGSDPNSPGGPSWGVIHDAALIDDDSDWLAYLLKHNANTELEDGEQRTPIFLAIKSRRKENLDLLIRAKANLNHQSSLESTPMMVAAGRGLFDSVYYLLESGADPRITSSKGNDLAYWVVKMDVDPQHSLGRWRQKVIDYLEREGVDLGPARRLVEQQKKDFDKEIARRRAMGVPK